MEDEKPRKEERGKSRRKWYNAMRKYLAEVKLYWNEITNLAKNGKTWKKFIVETRQKSILKLRLLPGPVGKFRIKISKEKEEIE